jgi:hypothetical protein
MLTAKKLKQALLKEIELMKTYKHSWWFLVNVIPLWLEDDYFKACSNGFSRCC